MSREIKFRAWDTYSKKIISWENLLEEDKKGDLALVLEESSTIGVFLMQFTGLKDKNGKEIYEGDIFRCIYHSDGHKDHLYHVVYNENSTSFGLQRTGNVCTQYAVRQEISDVARYEVIGNIYENSELLK